MGIKITEQDKVNIAFAKDILDKAGKAGKLPPGPVKWVGEKGFNTCVAHLTGKHGITNAKALCGALKGKARETGQLKKEHMGRIERKRKAKNRKFTKSELVDFLKSNMNYGQKMAEEFADLIFKKCSDGKISGKIKKVKKIK